VVNRHLSFIYRQIVEDYGITKKRLTVTHVSISLIDYLIMKGGNFFTKSIAKLMNIYQKCNDLHQKYQ